MTVVPDSNNSGKPWGFAVNSACPGHSTVLDQPITSDAVQQALDTVIQLPLLVPHDCDYPQMIEKVIQTDFEDFFALTKIWREQQP